MYHLLQTRARELLRAIDVHGVVHTEMANRELCSSDYAGDEIRGRNSFNICIVRSFAYFP